MAIDQITPEGNEIRFQNLPETPEGLERSPEGSLERPANLTEAEGSPEEKLQPAEPELKVSPVETEVKTPGTEISNEQAVKTLNNVLNEGWDPTKISPAELQDIANVAEQPSDLEE